MPHRRLSLLSQECLQYSFPLACARLWAVPANTLTQPQLQASFMLPVSPGSDCTDKDFCRHGSCSSCSSVIVQKYMNTNVEKSVSVHVTFLWDAVRRMSAQFFPLLWPMTCRPLLFLLQPLHFLRPSSLFHSFKLQTNFQQESHNV